MSNRVRIQGGQEHGLTFPSDQLINGVLDLPITDDSYMFKDSEGTYSWTASRYVLDPFSNILVYTGLVRYAFNLDKQTSSVERLSE